MKESGVKTVPLEREIISISPLPLVSPSQGSIYTHTAAQQVLPLFLFPAKEAPELQSHCPANPAAGSWQKAGVGPLAGAGDSPSSHPFVPLAFGGIGTANMCACPRGFNLYILGWD